MTAYLLSARQASMRRAMSAAKSPVGRSLGLYARIRSVAVAAGDYRLSYGGAPRAWCASDEYVDAKRPASRGATNVVLVEGLS
jgi:hypothetical protein